MTLGLQLSRTLADFHPPTGGSVISVGNFDGVHRGHQSVFREAVEAARPHGAAVVAITFDPSPLTVIAPERAPRRLTSVEEKLALLAAHGATDAILLHADEQLIRTSAEEFLRDVVAACRPRAIVEGPGFFFGRGRQGNVEFLRGRAASMGFEVREVSPTRVPERPELPRASSSAARELLTRGDVEGAAFVLGRPHRITGQVAHGQHRGAGIGFPTANLTLIEQLTPAAGVYGGAALLPDGRSYLAAINVGPQPTFGQAEVRVEAHLIDFAGDLYGRPIALAFVGRIRDVQRFESVDALRAQLERDVAAVRAHPEWAEMAGRAWCGVPIAAAGR
jgi:riboflavin kinase/FMN adenylyltransferase